MLARRVLDLDFDEVSKWYEKRNKTMPPKQAFPKVGFIVEGVACGFIYYTDSDVAIIDGYISNPDSKAIERDSALNQITTELIQNAAFHGIKFIKCDTKLEAIKKRANLFGFKSTGQYESFMLDMEL